MAKPETFTWLTCNHLIHSPTVSFVSVSLLCLLNCAHLFHADLGNKISSGQVNVGNERKVLHLGKW